MSTESVNHEVFAAVPLLEQHEEEETSPPEMETAIITDRCISSDPMEDAPFSFDLKLMKKILVVSCVAYVALFVCLCCAVGRTNQKHLHLDYMRQQQDIMRQQQDIMRNARFQQLRQRTMTDGALTTSLQRNEQLIRDTRMSVNSMPLSQHAIELTEETFEQFLSNHKRAFVNFYNLGCVSCLHMDPTWQKFAQGIHQAQTPVAVGQVNCLTQHMLCHKQHILGYPTLRWFEQPTDYKMDRTVDALMKFAERKVEHTDGVKVPKLSQGTALQPLIQFQTINSPDDRLQVARHHSALRTQSHQVSANQPNYAFDLRRMEADSQVIELTEESFGYFLKLNEMAFVNFCSPQCVWCQRLAPSWEQFAQITHENNMSVGVGRVNCTAHKDFCKQTQGILEFPTMRWYRSGVAQGPDYSGIRSIQGLVDFAKLRLEMDDNFKHWSTKIVPQGTKLVKASPQSDHLSGSYGTTVLRKSTKDFNGVISVSAPPDDASKAALFVSTVVTKT